MPVGPVPVSIDVAVVRTAGSTAGYWMLTARRGSYPRYTGIGGITKTGAVANVGGRTPLPSVEDTGAVAALKRARRRLIAVTSGTAPQLILRARSPPQCGR